MKDDYWAPETIDEAVMSKRRSMLKDAIARLDPDGKAPKKQLRRVAKAANILGLGALCNACETLEPRKAIRAIQEGWK